MWLRGPHGTYNSQPPDTCPWPGGESEPKPARGEYEGRLMFCRPLEQQMANLECNAVCGVAITHHFLAKMASFTLTQLRRSLVPYKLGLPPY